MEFMQFRTGIRFIEFPLPFHRQSCYALFNKGGNYAENNKVEQATFESLAPKITTVLDRKRAYRSHRYRALSWLTLPLHEVNMQPTSRYCKQELLACAHEQGLEATEHLLKDWVEKGLMGEADREWPGRGSIAWWSHAQRNLFLQLLKLRQRCAKPLPIGGLCTIPIGRWLYLGEERGGVSLPQVRRAMTTWMDYQQKFSAQHLAHCARKMLHKHADPKAEGKRHLVKQLADLAVSQSGLAPEEAQHIIDHEELEYDLDAVFTPDPTTQNKDHLIRDLLSIRAPIFFRVLQDPQPFLAQPDIIWKWARVAHFLALGGSQQEQAFFQANQEEKPIVSRVRLEFLMGRSGFELSEFLGMVKLNEYKAPHPFLNPQAWIEEKVAPPIVHPEFRIPFSLLLETGLAFFQYKITLTHETAGTQHIHIVIPKEGIVGWNRPSQREGEETKQ